MHQQYFKGAIWTNHALDRLKNRGFTQEMAAVALNYPDSEEAGENGTRKYKKRFDKSTVTVVAKQNEKSEWIVLSCWIDPPIPGTSDEKRQVSYRNYQKSSFWKKLFLTAARQLGIVKF